uniref:Uncharacterized protein n=1 Tax=Myripristis murdjan TaxID=586833 RepID=A0A667Y7H7_9TELE
TILAGRRKQGKKMYFQLFFRLMGAEGTKLDQDFVKMEKTLLVELLSRTTEFLQPNPGTTTNTTNTTTVNNNITT